MSGFCEDFQNTFDTVGLFFRQSGKEPGEAVCPGLGDGLATRALL